MLASASAGTEVERQSARFVETDATRGRIFDDRHRPLVLNRISLEVRVTKDSSTTTPRESSSPLRHPRHPRAGDPRGLDEHGLLRLSIETGRHNVDKDVGFYLSEHHDEFPGVEVVPAAVRDYPNGTHGRARPGLGGQIRADKIEDKRFKDYGLNDLVGKAGLEKQYERFLLGHKGRQKYLVNSNQEIVRLLGEEPAVPATTSCSRWNRRAADR